MTPGVNTIELYERLTCREGFHPFIVISALGKVPKAAQAMRSGAVDFVPKPIDHALLMDHVAEAIAKDATLRAKNVQRLALTNRLATLTKREREVLSFSVEGLASKQIAKRLDIDAITVDVHRSNLMKTMHVESIIQLAGQLTASGLTTTKRTTEQ